MVLLHVSEVRFGQELLHVKFHTVGYHQNMLYFLKLDKSWNQKYRCWTI